MKECNKCNIEKSLEDFYPRNNKCKECVIKQVRKCQEDNPAVLVKARNKYRSTDKYKKNEARLKTTDVRKEYIKKYREDNKDKIRIQRRAYKNMKKATDPLFVTTRRLRGRLQRAFAVSKWNKNNTTGDMLGCSFKTAHDHIESQFTEGMSWANRSEWHIDHIMPLVSATTEEELIKLCHYTNLQPLWAEENIKKGGRF
jgi:hypothetical protein